MTRNRLRTEPDYRHARPWNIASSLFAAAPMVACIGLVVWLSYRTGAMLLGIGLTIGSIPVSVSAAWVCRHIGNRYLRFDRRDLDAVPYAQMQEVAYSMWRAHPGTDAPCAFEGAARRWIARGQLPDWFTLNTNTTTRGGE